MYGDPILLSRLLDSRDTTSRIVSPRPGFAGYSATLTPTDVRCFQTFGDRRGSLGDQFTLCRWLHLVHDSTSRNLLFHGSDPYSEYPWVKFAGLR